MLHQRLTDHRDLCSIAEEYYLGEISLPMFADLTDHDQVNVISSLKNF